MLSPETEVAPVSTNFGIDPYFPLLYTREAVESKAVYRLNLQPGN